MQSELFNKTNKSISEFLEGAILGYCQSHEPEEVAELFTSTFNILSKEI